MEFPSVSILLGLVLFVLMAIKIGKRKKSTWINLPPGPRTLPVIGNMHVLMNGSILHHRLRDLAVKYGPLMHLKLGEVSHVIISSPEVAEQVMKTHDLKFCHRTKSYAADIVSYSSMDIVFTSYGDYWRQLRKITTLELLSAKRVTSFRHIREELVTDLIESISKSGSLINLSKMMHPMSYKIISKVAFGVECDDLETFIPTVQKIVQVVAGFNPADFFPSVKLLQSISRMTSEIKVLHERADKVLQNVIDKHIAARDNNKNNRSEDEKEDIVDVLLNLREHGKLKLPLTIDNIKALLLDIFIGGSESSTTTVEWAMSELMKNPRVMKKAQEEVRRVFKDAGNVSESEIHQLEYMNLVLKETFRLHPTNPILIPRECRERCEINGYEIPANSRVIINAWAIGRDPRHWKEPESFWPERFIESPTDYKGTDFKLIPFGAGRRICPGISFGVTSIELLLAQLLYHFDWNLPSGVNPENLDMTEKFGAVVKRKKHLYLVPTPYRPLTV